MNLSAIGPWLSWMLRAQQLTGIPASKFAERGGGIGV
jgi:hypothetical protein